MCNTQYEEHSEDYKYAVYQRHFEHDRKRAPDDYRTPIHSALQFCLPGRSCLYTIAELELDEPKCYRTNRQLLDHILSGCESTKFLVEKPLKERKNVNVNLSNVNSL